MARPVVDTSALNSAIEGWDATLRDIADANFSQPFAVKEYADVASLPAANLFDRCIVATVSPAKLWFSVAGAWKAIQLEP